MTNFDYLVQDFNRRRQRAEGIRLVALFLFGGPLLIALVVGAALGVLYLRAWAIVQVWQDHLVGQLGAPPTELTLLVAGMFVIDLLTYHRARSSHDSEEENLAAVAGRWIGNLLRPLIIVAISWLLT